MGTNPGAWLSGLGPAGALFFVAVGFLVILGVCAILVAAYKTEHRVREVRISWKEISVRWSQEAPQEESEALEQAPEDAPAVDQPRAVAGDTVTPKGGDAVA
ncbi:hypothetical protein GCM10022224_018130 [Nonomuraea antimicrobica]|uniref:Secreted protein n=1 Tax=Nonomuraea antimicrobica TaxID=561173 RepID=A0ABP7BD55_9ACTN